MCSMQQDSMQIDFQTGQFVAPTFFNIRSGLQENGLEPIFLVEPPLKGKFLYDDA